MPIWDFRKVVKTLYIIMIMNKKKCLRLVLEMLLLYVFLLVLYAISGKEMDYIWIAVLAIVNPLFVDWTRNRLG